MEKLSAFHNYIDNYIYGYFENEFMPDCQMYLSHFRIPIQEKIKFTDDSKRVIEVLRFPSRRKDFLTAEIRYNISMYISLWASIFYWKLFKNIRRFNVIFSSFWGLCSFPFIVATHYSLVRCRDVKALYCIDGRTIAFQTLQDGDKKYEFDLSQIRIVSRENRGFVCFIDIKNLSNFKPVFYFINYDLNFIPNKLVFEKLMIEQKYLKYTI